MKGEKEGMPTLVKWAGGKKQLIEQFKPFFPKKITTYIEPFVGGGAIAFYVLKNHPEIKKVLLSDLNEELINTYVQVQKHVEELIIELEQHKEYHSERGLSYYKEIRSSNPKDLSPIVRAARFIYLNKTCFNGIYRVNSKGEFNVPMGKYANPAICDSDSLREISKLLNKKKVIFKTMSFEEVLRFAKKGNFLYLDPPYFPIKKASFTSYTKDNFLHENHKKLFEIFDKLNRRGCKLMLSNSDAPFIKNLYSGYKQIEVSATRMINCDATKRGKIKELVIMNNY